jgi:hypothetical protein
MRTAAIRQQTDVDEENKEDDANHDERDGNPFNVLSHHRPKSPGSLATFTAMRCASSKIRTCA